MQYWRRDTLWSAAGTPNAFGARRFFENVDTTQLASTAVSLPGLRSCLRTPNMGGLSSAAT
jgi:hypothetical protein